MMRKSQQDLHHHHHQHHRSSSCLFSVCFNFCLSWGVVVGSALCFSMKSSYWITKWEDRCIKVSAPSDLSLFPQEISIGPWPSKSIQVFNSIKIQWTIEFLFLRLTQLLSAYIYIYRERERPRLNKTELQIRGDGRVSAGCQWWMI